MFKKCIDRSLTTMIHLIYKKHFTNNFQKMFRHFFKNGGVNMGNVIENAKKKLVITGKNRVQSVTALYAMDLGNGFTKRVFDGSGVKTEPSVFAEVPKHNNSSRHYFSLDKEFHYFVGQNVIDANLEPEVAINGRERYFTEEYKRMLLGFISSDFVDYDEVKIPILVLGVPDTDHKAVQEKMEDFYSGRFIVTIDRTHQLTISIQTCIVLPQPVGTYAYAVSKGIVSEWGDKVLVCDAGYGTFDVASITGDIIKRDVGMTLGAIDAYMEIRDHLKTKYGNLAAFTLENMSTILKNGVIQDGEATAISNEPEVVKCLDLNFKKMYDFLQKEKFDFDEHSRVLWTGGTSLLHKERIESKKKQTFVVIEDAQEANVLGFYEIAKDIAKEGGLNGGEEEISDVCES